MSDIGTHPALLQLVGEEREMCAVSEHEADHNPIRLDYGNLETCYWTFEVPSGKRVPKIAALILCSGDPRSEASMTTPATISEGASGPVVRWLQYRLVRRTLSDNQIDGVFGPVTKGAVEEFQTYSHLAVDGIVGPATWSALGGDGAEPPSLGEGSDGTVVEKLQTALNEGRGDFAPSTNPVLAIDGSYGPLTATAVKGAQRSGAIEVDGIVGLQSWALPVHAAGQVLADLCGVPGPG